MNDKKLMKNSIKIVFVIIFIFSYIFNVTDDVESLTTFTKPCEHMHM